MIILARRRRCAVGVSLRPARVVRIRLVRWILVHRHYLTSINILATIQSGIALILTEVR